MTDQNLLEEIRKGNREKPLSILYKDFGKVKSNIISSGGNKEIAQEIFNDALMLLVEKVEDPKFELTSKLTTYLYGIARFLWMNELRKQNKTQSVEWSETLILTQEDLGYDFEKEEKLQAVERIIDQLKAKCKQIFELFYYQKQSMKVVADKLNFKSVNSAKTQKHKCMEQAIQLANQL